MGRLGDLLVRKHSVIATNLFALSVGAGFLYTMRTGQSALSDAKAALSGESAAEQPLRAYQMRFR